MRGAVLAANRPAKRMASSLVLRLERVKTTDTVHGHDRQSGGIPRGCRRTGLIRHSDSVLDGVNRSFSSRGRGASISRTSLRRGRSRRDALLVPRRESWESGHPERGRRSCRSGDRCLRRSSRGAEAVSSEPVFTSLTSQRPHLSCLFFLCILEYKMRISEHDKDSTCTK